MNRYTVELTPTAQKELDGLPAKEMRRILKALAALANNPRPQGSVKLAGGDSLYRIRVGSGLSDRKLLVLVVRVRHHKDAYD